MLADLASALDQLENGDYDKARSMALEVVSSESPGSSQGALGTRLGLQIAAIASRKLGEADAATELKRRATVFALPAQPSEEEMGLIQRVGELLVNLAEETYLNLDPEALVYANLGAEAARAGDIQAADECFTKAIEIDPNCELAHFNRGVSAYNRRAFDEARASMSEVLRINPANAKASEILRTLG